MKIAGRGPLKKRKLDAGALNLVPMIDLFSMIIIFLIVTAAFDQLAQMKINMGSEDAAETVIKQPVKEIQASLKITIFPDRLDLQDQGRVVRIEKQPDDEEYNWDELNEFLMNARVNYPEKKDIVIFSSDKVEYGYVVTVMDFALSQDFNELVVSGVE